MARGGARPGTGAKPGQRNGGRVKGQLNRATVERTLLAQRELADAKATGRKLAKEVLEEFMMLFAGMAAVHQPLPPGVAQAPGRTPDDAKFLTYAEHTVDCAHKLAPYQSPTFRAIVIAPPPEPQSGEKVVKFTLTIFEDGKPVKEIEGPRRRVIDHDDDEKKVRR